MPYVNRRLMALIQLKQSQAIIPRKRQQETTMNNEMTANTDISAEDSKGKRAEDYFFRASAADFKKIPGSPIAYWVGKNVLNAFEQSDSFEAYATPKQGLATGKNEKFLRFWFEIEAQNINFKCSSLQDSKEKEAIWVPYSKGGFFRKWYGCHMHVVSWNDGGEDIKNFKDENGKELSRFRAARFYFKEAVTWGLVTSGFFSARYREPGYVFDIAGMSVFSENNWKILGLLNSSFSRYVLSLINPTLNYQTRLSGLITQKSSKIL
jgi:hypothetical protein